MVIDELFKKTRRLNLSFNCAHRYFVKSKFGYWYRLICSYESTYTLLVDFD